VLAVCAGLLMAQAWLRNCLLSVGQPRCYAVAQRWVSGVFLLQFSLFRSLSLFSGVKCLQFVLPQRHGLFVLCDVLGSLVG
jgi:hypothetical protein